MKIITSINTVAAKTVAVIMNTCVNAISLSGDERETWVRLGKWGEYPGAINLPGGAQRKANQVLDREGAEQMKKTFYSAINQIAHLGKGLPIYEGHPDEPRWRKLNPNVPTNAVGRIKDIEIREDGPYVRTVFNARGAALIGGDAPELSAHSPRFTMAAMPGQPEKFRIVGVLSLGLTNDPNMPDTAISLNESTDNPPEADPVQPQQETNMKLNTDIMKRLGLNPEASEDATATAVNTVLSEREQLTGDITSTKEKLTSANERITSLKKEADKFRDLAVDTTLTTAINSGRITEADKPKWDAALKADFDGEKSKLDALMPTSINTEDKLGNLAKRKGEQNSAGTGITAINSAVAAFAKENNLDLTNGADYSTAFSAVQEAKPELFA